MVAWAMSVLLAIMAAGCVQTESSEEPKPAGITASSAGASVKTLGGGPIWDGEWVSLEVAERQMPFSVLQPGYLPDGIKLSGVMVTRADTGAVPTVALVYSDGMEIIHALVPSPDPDLLEQELNTPGWTLVEIDGVSTAGRDPSDYTGIGGTTRNPGAVGWWKDGIGHSVTGDRPLNELVRIANSLR